MKFYLSSFFSLFHRNVAMFRQPSLSSTYNILTLPFTLGVWIVLMVIFLIFVLTLVFLARMDNYFKQNMKNALHFQEIITLVHGAFCQQGK